MRGDYFSPDVRELVELFERHGVRYLRQVPFAVIGLADLVKNKRAAGRHKDLDDAEHLEPLLRGRPE